MDEGSEKHTPLEIVVVHRSESKPPGRWDNAEKLARLLSLVAIPVVLAILGWLIQDTLTRRNVSQEYVNLSVQILTNRNDVVDPGIRDWAVDLLNDNAPIRLSDSVVARLKSGEAAFPRPTEAVPRHLSFWFLVKDSAGIHLGQLELEVEGDHNLKTVAQRMLEAAVITNQIPESTILADLRPLSYVGTRWLDYDKSISQLRATETTIALVSPSLVDNPDKSVVLFMPFLDVYFGNK